MNNKLIFYLVYFLVDMCQWKIRQVDIIGRKFYRPLQNTQTKHLQISSIHLFKTASLKIYVSQFRFVQFIDIKICTD